MKQAHTGELDRKLYLSCMAYLAVYKCGYVFNVCSPPNNTNWSSSLNKTGLHKLEVITSEKLSDRALASMYTVKPQIRAQSQVLILSTALSVYFPEWIKKIDYRKEGKWREVLRKQHSINSDWEGGGGGGIE